MSNYPYANHTTVDIFQPISPTGKQLAWPRL